LTINQLKFKELNRQFTYLVLFLLSYFNCKKRMSEIKKSQNTLSFFL